MSDLALASRTGRLVVAAAVLGSGMVMLDGTVVNVALVRIGADLGASMADLQWITNGYLLALASFILLGGSLGDRYGRRRVFVIGVVWFTVASVACGLAQTPGQLIAARVLQGVGGALLTPGSLALIQASFRRDDRATAIGAWSGLGGVAAAIGPFVGGWLVEYASWRWAFLLNVPLGVATVWVAQASVPESRDECGVARVRRGRRAARHGRARPDHLRAHPARLARHRRSPSWSAASGSRQRVRSSRSNARAPTLSCRSASSPRASSARPTA